MRSTRLLLSLFILILCLVGCAAAPPQWAKPGATEEDLEAAKIQCDRRNVASRFGIRDPMIPEDPMFTPRRGRGRGAAEMAQELCLEKKGWVYQE